MAETGDVLPVLTLLGVGTGRHQRRQRAGEIGDPPVLGRIEELALDVLFRRQAVFGAEHVQAHRLVAGVDLDLDAVAAHLGALGIETGLEPLRPVGEPGGVTVLLVAYFRQQQHLLEDALVVAARPLGDDRLDFDVAAPERGQRVARKRRRRGTRGLGLEIERRIVEGMLEEHGVQLGVVLDVVLRLSALHLVEGWLGDIDVAALDQLRHLPVEEGQEQGPYVRSVNISVGHYDYAVVAQFLDVEVVAADTAAERRDQRADLHRGEHLVEAGPLDVQDLALERQHGLGTTVAALFGGAACGVALDEEHLGQRRILFLAVGQLARQAGDVEHALAAGKLARLARRLSRARGVDDLRDDGFRLGRTFQQELLELRGHRVLDHATHFGRDELVLRLRRELRVRHLHRQDRGQALARVIARGLDLLLLRFALDVLVERAGQCRAETLQVGAAVLLRNVVREAVHRLLVGIVPLRRDLDRDRRGRRQVVGMDRDLGTEIEHRRVHWRLRAVQVADERAHPALVLEHLGPLVALVDELDTDARVQERQLAQAAGQRVVLELDIGKCLGARPEADLGTVALRHRRTLDDRQRGLWLAVAVFLVVDLLVAEDRQDQVLGQRVDHRHADAVQAAADLVAALAELTAGVQDGHDDLGRRPALFRVDIHRDTAPVVGHRDGFVGVDNDPDAVAVAGQGLVDGVVDDFEHHVVQAAAVIGVADVHARPFAYGIEAF